MENSNLTSVQAVDSIDESVDELTLFGVMSSSSSVGDSIKNMILLESSIRA